MTDTFISTIISTYNYARFLPEAIESVLAQTYPHQECIVVDDGSTDATRAVLAAYSGRLRVIRKEHRGISSARNAGIAVAKGEFIAFLDADDWWEPQKLAIQSQFLAQNPDIGAVGCGAALFGRSREKIGESIPARCGDKLADNLRAIAQRKLWLGGSASGAMVRRAVLHDVGVFDEQLMAAEDWDLWLRISAKHRIHNLPELLTNIRRHGTGMFRNVRLMEENQWLVYHKAVALWPGVIDQPIRRRMQALILADAGGEAVTAGNYRLALRYYLRSLCRQPIEAGHWRKVVALTLRSWPMRSARN